MASAPNVEIRKFQPASEILNRLHGAVSQRTSGADMIAASGSPPASTNRSEEHTSELQSLMRISYAVFCLKKKKHYHIETTYSITAQNNNHLNSMNKIQP